MISNYIFLNKLSDPAKNEEPVDKKPFFSGLLAHAFKGLGLVWDAVNTSPIQRLPEEILTHIFSFLSPRDLKTCWFVNSQWQRCSLSSHLWRNFTLREGRSILENAPAPHRTFYKFYPPRVANRAYKPKKVYKSSLPAPSIFENTTRAERCIWRGQYFAASHHAEKTIRIWDVVSEEILLEVPRFHRRFDISGPILVTSSQKKDSVKFDTWSSSAAKRTRRSRQKVSIPDYINFFIYQENVVVRRKTSITLFQRANLKETVTIKPNMGICSAAMHETLLACCNEAGNCTVWDTRSQAKVFETDFHAPSTVSFVSDSLAASCATSIQFWDLRRPEQFSFEIQTPRFSCWDHHENLVAVAESQKFIDPIARIKSISVDLWNARSGQKISSLYRTAGVPAMVWDMRWVGDQLVLIDRLGERTVWDFNA